MDDGPPPARRAHRVVVESDDSPMPSPVVLASSGLDVVSSEDDGYNLPVQLG